MNQCKDAPSRPTLPVWGAGRSGSPPGRGMSPSHLHLEAEVRARHVLPVVLIEALVLGHSKVVLPVPADPWG